MKIAIFSGGSCPSKSLVKEELISCDYIICADSGANCVYKYDLYPDYIVGDMDSISSEALEFYSNTEVKIEKYPPEKDFTDTELAFNKAIELGAEEMIFFGCTGSRLDHFLGNLAMLFKCLQHNIQGMIIDDNNKIFMINKSTKLSGYKGKNFSLVPYSESIEGLTIKGAKYCLDDYYLTVGTALTLSNEFKDDSVEIYLRKGILLVLYSVD